MTKTITLAAKKIKKLAKLTKLRKSVALYYQIVGRAMRIAPTKKDAWIVDLGGHVNFFGKIGTMKMEQTKTGLHYISNNGRQFTNVPFEK